MRGRVFIVGLGLGWLLFIVFSLRLVLRLYRLICLNLGLGLLRFSSRRIFRFRRYELAIRSALACLARSLDRLDRINILIGSFSGLGGALCAFRFLRGSAFARFLGAVLKRALQCGAEIVASLGSGAVSHLYSPSARLMSGPTRPMSVL